MTVSGLPPGDIAAVTARAMLAATLSATLPGRTLTADGTHGPVSDLAPRLLPKFRDRLAVLLGEPNRLPALDDDPRGQTELADGLLVSRMYVLDELFTQQSVAAAGTLADATISSVPVAAPFGLLLFDHLVEPLGCVAYSWITDRSTGNIRLAWYRRLSTSRAGTQVQKLREQVGWLIPMGQAVLAPRIVLSWGMGIESTAVIVRWLREPASRDFDLSGLVLVVAQTGSEYTRTHDLCDRLALPLLRQAGVRLVQLARPALHQQSPGYLVLDDSRTPTRMIRRGPVTLADELSRNGTIPLLSGHRKCSLKWKGTVIDSWLKDHVPHGFRHALGYNRSEGRRIARDAAHTTHGRRPEYPLLQWHWDRTDTASYLESVFGGPWSRSCCVYCPFQTGTEIADWANRWAAEPSAAALALRLEHTAMSLNPNMRLFSGASAWELVSRWGMAQAVDLATDDLNQTDWSLYEVRRIYSQPGVAMRSILTLATGTRTHVTALLSDQAPDGVLDSDGVPRLWLRRRAAEYPAVEHQLVVAAAGVVDKQPSRFEREWDRLNQLSPAAARR